MMEEFGIRPHPVASPWMVAVICWWSMLRIHTACTTQEAPLAALVRRILFFLAQTKMSGVARSLRSTRDKLSGSRFRAVQCYDDPTMAVVADLTRTED